MLFQAVIGACLEPLEVFCVCPLSLVVAPGMSHRRKVELGVDALAILLEEPTCKLGPVVRNDMAWDPKSIDNQPEESNSSTLGDIDHRGGLWPLRELVNGDKEETVPADGPGEWSQDIHPPYGEWPGGWNHLQSQSLCVYLLCMELTRLAGLYHLSCILGGLTDQKALLTGVRDDE
jgi:hypothetical protein